MIEQRSPEWFEQRKCMITGSKVGSIIGVSPFAKPDDVMREMVREYFGAEREFTGNVATEYGNENEEAAIFALEMEQDITVEETGFHKLNEWLGASPDGLVGDNAVVEVKCPYGKRQATSEVDFKCIEEQPHYYAQMQIEMYCTKREYCHFYQWAENASKYELIQIDHDWLNKYLPMLEAFYVEFTKITEQGEEYCQSYLEDAEKDMSFDDEWLDLEQKLVAASAELEQAKDKVDSYKQALIEMTKGRKCVSTHLTVFKTKRQGSISYAKAIKDLKIEADFEQYRGKASESWTVKVK